MDTKLRIFKHHRGKLAEDPLFHQVQINFEGRTLLGDVRGMKLDLETGRTKLVVHHFNGEPWPIEPDSGFVLVMKRDPVVDFDPQE